MSKYTVLDEALHDYIVEHGAREDAALVKVREGTAALGEISVMQVAPDQGALMTMLTRLCVGDGDGRAIEVGTFTGYSAICIARGLGHGGRLVACELDPERAASAAASFAEAGVAERIDLRVGAAAETLAELEAADGEPFDLAFIDADKTGYLAYYESCLRLLRQGGLIVLDNVLQDGKVLEPEGEESPEAIDSLNRMIRDDDRVEIAMVAVADGITLALKR